MNDRRTGNYVKQLTGDLHYRAFIPNNLPFEIIYDENLNSLLSKANLSIGRLDGVAENLPDVDYFIYMYVGKEAASSSQIEGTQATLSDYLKVESKIENIEIKKDVDEIKNYIDAINYGIKRLNEFPLSLPLIQELHKKLLKGVRGQNRAPGEFRRTQNWVGGVSLESAIYIPPSVNEMKQALYELEKFLHLYIPIPVLVKIALIHYQFETIHPFLDGNGRIGRLLITLFLIHSGVLKKPLLYLSDFFKKHRQEYYDRLNNAREKDDLEGWLKFFLEGIRITSDNAVHTIKKINNLKIKDTMLIQKSGYRGSNLINVYNHLFKSPYINAPVVEDITGIKRKNSINLLTRLENLGILKEITGNLKNKIYVYEEYENIFKSQ